MGLASSWWAVVEALERVIPSYERMNAAMSLGRDVEYRRLGVRLAARGGCVAVDAGCGPGVTTALLVEEAKPSAVLMLDASPAMLEEAKRRLGSYGRAALVLGTFEALPVRDGAADLVAFTFSLRDALDMDAALREARRALRPGGKLLLVDLGKPDARPLRLAIKLYWLVAVPLLAFLLAPRSWRYYLALYTTYDSLPTNGALAAKLGELFLPEAFRELMLGAAVVAVARRVG